MNGKFIQFIIKNRLKKHSDVCFRSSFLPEPTVGNPENKSWDPPENQENPSFHIIFRPLFVQFFQQFVYGSLQLSVFTRHNRFRRIQHQNIRLQL